MSDGGDEYENAYILSLSSVYVNMNYLTRFKTKQHNLSIDHTKELVQANIIALALNYKENCIAKEKSFHINLLCNLNIFLDIPERKGKLLKLFKSSWIN